MGDIGAWKFGRCFALCWDEVLASSWHRVEGLFSNRFLFPLSDVQTHFFFPFFLFSLFLVAASICVIISFSLLFDYVLWPVWIPGFFLLTWLRFGFGRLYIF